MKSSISRSAVRLFTAQNPDEVLAALDNETDAVIGEFAAQHKRSCNDAWVGALGPDSNKGQRSNREALDNPDGRSVGAGEATRYSHR